MKCITHINVFEHGADRRQENIVKKPVPVTATVLLSFLLSCLSSPSRAQVNHSAPSAQSPSTPAGSGAVDDDDSRAPVMRVTSVEVIRSTHGGTLDIIRVRGLVSSEGWEEAELVPLTRGKPADGILELVFMAKPPAQAMEAKGFEVVEAIFPLETNHSFKGVNVHSAQEALALTQLPGFVDGRPVGEDCHQCVGKSLVLKGQSAPPGKNSADVVMEERLPPNTHIIKAGDGVGKPDSDPNRLTIIVNGEGKITTAVWD
jgi:hypothetical protein